MCNFSIVSFVIYLPLILIFVSIHDIPSNLIFIMYLLYFTFFVFLFIYGFNTPYIWEANYKPMRLTRTNEWEFVYTFFAYIMCVDHCHRHFLINFFMWFLISYFCSYYYGMTMKNPARLFHWIHHKNIIFPFSIHYLNLIFPPITKD